MNHCVTRIANRRALSVLAGAIGLLGPSLALASTAAPPSLVEVMAGANGDSRLQFVEIEAEGACFAGATPRGAARLLFYDALGRETGRFDIPRRHATRGTHLIATAELARLRNAPAPDFVMPALLNAVSGKVCLEAPDVRHRECLSYGAFIGDTEGRGAPAPALEIVDTRSLKRRTRNGQNADFVVSQIPSPTNGRGATFRIPVASRVAQGETLFFHETFQGNGRTCGSCHVAADSFSLTPANVAARFATLAQTYDPLFIAESTAFDFNLNTLTLAAAPQPRDLTGRITGAQGVAKVLGRIGPTTYLVYGGMNPPLSGTVTDGTSSAPVASIVAGDLNALEDPRLMRIVDPPLPIPGLPPVPVPRRSVILENMPGPFEFLAVFRESPHLLNLRHTAPYGLSGEFADLRTFSRGAVRQHFPRTLARVEGRDFRVPTDDELQALEAFQLDHDHPRGNDPDKFNLDRFATTAEQRLGRQVFFGDIAKCSKCHNGRLLNETDGTAGKPAGPAKFNTGVSAQFINRPDGDNLPPTEFGEDGTLNGREFDTPSLFNVRNTGPYFHDASVKFLVDAAFFFYNGGEFNSSPAARAIGGIDMEQLSIPEINALMSFVNSLTERPYTLTRGPIDFGTRAPGAPATPVRRIAITNTSTEPVAFTSPGCLLTGPDAAQFGVVSCPLTTPLQPRERRLIEVSFNPSAPGARSAILEVKSPVPSGVDLLGQLAQ